MFCFVVRLEINPNMFVGERGKYFIAQGKDRETFFTLAKRVESSEFSCIQVKNCMSNTEVLNISLNKWNCRKLYLKMNDDKILAEAMIFAINRVLGQQMDGGGFKLYYQFI